MSGCLWGPILFGVRPYLSSYCLHSKFGVVMDKSDLNPSRDVHELLF